MDIGEASALMSFMLAPVGTVELAYVRSSCVDIVIARREESIVVLERRIMSINRVHVWSKAV